jgi:hypothetical protein
MADNRFIRKQKVLSLMARIPADVRRVAREAVDEQAAYLVEQIRPAVPRDHGDLADSLEWRRSPRMDKIAVVITEGAKDDTLGRKARAVEFGRPDMQAQPHFFPTYRANKRKMRNAINRRIRTAIRKIWGGNT